MAVISEMISNGLSGTENCKSGVDRRITACLDAHTEVAATLLVTDN